MLADVGSVIKPRFKLPVQVIQGGERPAGQERVLHVLHASLNFAFRSGPIRWAGYWGGAVMLAEIQERTESVTPFSGQSPKVGAVSFRNGDGRESEEAEPLSGIQGEGSSCCCPGG